MNRPSYKKVDIEDRDAYISSRENVLSKSFVTDLWMKVIIRAIEDLALYSLMRQKGKTLKEDDLENEQSALGFLFDDEYKIPMDDYSVDVKCPKCGTIWSGLLSTVMGQNSKCPSCSCIINRKYVEYTITENQEIKDISLQELISLWGVEDIVGFRSGVRDRIEEIVSAKLKE